MRDVLVVLNPRRIPECERALVGLPIDRLHIRGYTERQIADGVFSSLVDGAADGGYEWLWVVSDDAIVREPALAAVRALRDTGHHPVVTGYSQRSHTEWDAVNLTRAPLSGEHPAASSYEFRSFAEVVSWPEPIVPTWFAGMSLTGMSVDLWREHPFGCFGEPGWASDYHLSLRLQEAGVPIVAAREAFCYHWRHTWESTSDPRDATPSFDVQEIVRVVRPDVSALS